jgi:hypothetical protein
VLFLKDGRVAMFGEREHVLQALKERSAEPLPQGALVKGRRRLASGDAPTGGFGHNATAATGAP